MSLRLSITIILLSCLLTIYSCAFFAEDVVPDSSKALLEEAIKAAKLDQPFRALKLLQQIVEDFPDSNERKTAMLLVARSHYKLEDYEEAKFHFQKFIDLYPTHKNIDRAFFFKAMTDYQRIDLALRDQTATKDARDGFQQIINQFPKSQYLKQAKQKLNECRFKLSKNIFEIGKFYYRTGAYHSAISRFTNLLTDHAKQKFFDEAAFLLAESHYHEQSFKEAFLLYKDFTKKYPKSRFAPEVKKRLKILK